MSLWQTITTDQELWAAILKAFCSFIPSFIILFAIGRLEPLEIMAEPATPNNASSSGNKKSFGASIEAVFRPTLIVVLLSVFLVASQSILTTAYTIRLHAIENFGYIIHEFDPYFNFRAAQYLYDNGWKAFVNWFDYKVWYPLGRPVGTTIYPGMQVTAVWLTKSWLPFWFGVREWFHLPIPSNVVAKSAWDVSSQLAGEGSNFVMSRVASTMATMGMRWNEMSLNDVCCLMPAWFGALATFITGMLALECTANFGYGKGSEFGTVFDHVPILGFVTQKISKPIRITLADAMGMDLEAGSVPPGDRSSMQTASLFSMLATMFFMSIVPAHIMRSVGGGYDNECVAMAAMTLVFYTWTRSLRGTADGEEDKTDEGFKLSPRSRSAAFYGALTGLAYFNMVAAWGGYVFVVNLVGAHAAALSLLGMSLW